jgi:hypothetical protein
MPDSPRNFFDDLLALTHLSVVDHHVVVVRDVIDSNGAEGERVEANGYTSVTIVAPALDHENINLRAYTRIGWQRDSAVTINLQLLVASRFHHYAAVTMRCFAAALTGRA